jgi:hypothetical protein
LRFGYKVGKSLIHDSLECFVLSQAVVSGLEVLVEPVVVKVFLYKCNGGFYLFFYQLLEVYVCEEFVGFDLLCPGFAAQALLGPYLEEPPQQRLGLL